MLVNGVRNEEELEELDYAQGGFMRYELLDDRQDECT
jgi:hypothetical protein